MTSSDLIQTIAPSRQQDDVDQDAGAAEVLELDPPAVEARLRAALPDRRRARSDHLFSRNMQQSAESRR